MSGSATPILDLEVSPPERRASISAVGLLKAIPAAVGVIALVPLTMYVVFTLRLDPPTWFHFFSPIAQQLKSLFANGPWLAIAAVWIAAFVATLVHEVGHAIAATALSWPVTEFRVLPFCLE